MKKEPFFNCLISALIFCIAVLLSASVYEETAAVYNVVPEMDWAKTQKESFFDPSYFTFGDSINEFTFEPIDITAMQYLEFDVYIPNTAVVHLWDDGETQFEITSSGTCDAEELSWTGGELWNDVVLNDGWNHVRLPLPRESDADYSRINYIRWFWVGGDPEQTVPGCRAANLRFTTEGGVDPEKAELVPFIPDTLYETEDIVTALADVTADPYNADPTGGSDASAAIRAALNDVNRQGGGTVWMPAGKYRITGPITIPSYVTLRGDWTDPDISAGYGTLIIADVPEEDRNDTGLFLLGGSGGVYGLTVYYPEQSPGNVHAYPFTFYSDALNDNFMLPTVQNCTILNGYRGIGATTLPDTSPFHAAHESLIVRNFRGTFLKCGAEVYNEADFGFWENVHISDRYWVEAAKAGILSVDETGLAEYTRSNTTGLVLGDLEWAMFEDITVEDCAIGIRTVPGTRIEFSGAFHHVTIRNCGKGVVLDSLYEDLGMVLADSVIEGGIYNNTKSIAKLFNTQISGDRQGRFRQDSDPRPDLTDRFRTHGYPKPDPILYTAELDFTGETDVSAGLQNLLDRAGETGGVVFLPGGLYRLEAPVSVPAGVELKGTSPLPTRDQALHWNGTVLLSYYEGYGNGAEDPALITLDGNGAGMSGIRINYPANYPYDEDLNTSYAVRGRGENVFLVNCSIAAASHGVDFSGCDGHTIEGLVTTCYKNAMRVGGKDGLVKDCLQNGNMLARCAVPYVEPIDEDHIFSDLFDPILRQECDYMIIEDASEELIYNVGTYGVHSFVINRNGENTAAVNVSADNLGGDQFIMDSGSMTVINVLRYNGNSIRHEKGSLNVYNRYEHAASSGIVGDGIEPTYIMQK